MNWLCTLEPKGNHVNHHAGSGKDGTENAEVPHLIRQASTLWFEKTTRSTPQAVKQENLTDNLARYMGGN